MKTIHYALLGATACLALAGCGKKSTETVTTTANGTTTVESSTGSQPATESSTVATTSNGTNAVVSSTGSQPASAASLGIKPGQWQTRIEVTDLKMSGVAGMPAMPKPAPMTVTSCLTPEQASKGPGELLKNAKIDCTSTRNVYENGRMDVAMTCKMPSGGTMSTKTIGTYSPTEMTSDAEVEMTGRVSMTQKVHSTAKRIGECTG